MGFYDRRNDGAAQFPDMPRTAHDVLREICAALPETEEFVSHGSPTFRVRGGKVFAIFTVNHHGDGRVALWLAAPAGAQALHVNAEPRHYFIPSYVGTRGWLGVRLDRGIAWSRVTQLLREAYLQIAPPQLGGRLGKLPRFAPPTSGFEVSELDPMQSKSALRAIRVMREVCLALPETSEGLQFGMPVWRVGRRVFAQCYSYEGPVHAAFWVGVQNQALMSSDPRFTIPAFMGHNGWIALDVSKSIGSREIEPLALDGYRHFALKRMLKALG